MDQSRLNRLHIATNNQLGQRVLIKPQSSCGYVIGKADPQRQEAVVLAYAARGVSIMNSSGATPGDANARLRVSVDTVKIQTSALPYEVQEGDLVQLLDVINAPTLRISRVAPYGTDRTILFLVRTAR